MTEFKGFTQDDVDQILRVIDGLSDVEVRLEVGDLMLHVRKFGAAGALPAAAAVAPPPVPAALPPPPAEPVQLPGGAVEIPPGAVAIRAPMLGTFYRRPSPAEPFFVEVGQAVRAGEPVGLIEVMKLFNTVNAETDGRIVAAVAENGQLVEQDDLLFIVEAD